VLGPTRLRVAGRRTQLQGALGESGPKELAPFVVGHRLRQETSRVVQLALHGVERFAQHPETESLLLRDFGLNPDRQLVGTKLGGLRQGEDPDGVARVISHLRLAQQDVALHGGVVCFLGPLGSSVVPVGRFVESAGVPVEPARKLGATGGQRQEL